MPWCIQHMSVLYATGNPNGSGSLSVSARKGEAGAGEPSGAPAAPAADRCPPQQLHSRDCQRSGSPGEETWTRSHLGSKDWLRHREENAFAFLERARTDARRARLWGARAERGDERLPAVQEEQGLPLGAVILLLVWGASADGLWLQRCEYLSGFACWNTSTDLFYSPSPVRFYLLKKMSEEAKEKNAKPAHRKKKGKKVTPCTNSRLWFCFWLILCSTYLLLGVEWLRFDNLFWIRMVVESGWFCLC